MSSEAQPKSCGDCRNFDLNDTNGQAFGIVRRVNGTKGEGGVCRDTNGLVLGMRGPEFPCQQSIGTFAPRDEHVLFLPSKPVAHDAHKTLTTSAS